MLWTKEEGREEVEIEVGKEREKNKHWAQRPEASGQRQELGRVQCSMGEKPVTSSLILLIHKTSNASSHPLPKEMEPRGVPVPLIAFHRQILSTQKYQALTLLSSAEKNQSWLSPKVVDLDSALWCLRNLIRHIECLKTYGVRGFKVKGRNSVHSWTRWG